MVDCIVREGTMGHESDVVTHPRVSLSDLHERDGALNFRLNFRSYLLLKALGPQNSTSGYHHELQI
jgi:hypothetical protein